MIEWSSLLSPLLWLVGAVLGVAHQLLARVGLPGDSAGSWVLSICLLVVVVRTVMLPLVVHQVRLAHAAARAHPDLDRIRRRYRGRTDAESLRKASEEMRAVRREHGLGVWSSLPLLVQLPVMSALYLVLRDVSAGLPVASISLQLAQSAQHAEVFGLGLSSTLAGTGIGLPGLVLAALIVGTAAVGYLTQRHLVLPNLPVHALEGPLGRTQSLMPGVGALAVLVSAPLLPAGIVVYWLAGALWTAAQQAVILRWAPTPGSAAAGG